MVRLVDQFIFCVYVQLDPIWYEIGKQKAMLMFRATKGVKITWFVIWKVLKKNQLTKSDWTKTQGGKFSVPCQTGLTFIFFKLILIDLIYLEVWNDY